MLGFVKSRTSYSHDHSGNGHNNHRVEITTELQTEGGVLFSPEKERHVGTCGSMDRPWEGCAQRIKSSAKRLSFLLDKAPRDERQRPGLGGLVLDRYRVPVCEDEKVPVTAGGGGGTLCGCA